MRKLYATVLLAVLAAISFVSTAHCQAESDSIEYTRIAIKPANGSGAIYMLTENPPKLITVFGTPESTSNAFSELDKATINRYNFKDLEVYFEGSNLFSLKIKGTAVALVLNDATAVKVGDHISTLGTLFPKSYAAKADGQMLLTLKRLDGTPANATVGFWYNEDGEITEIII